jgi:predicted enzyme related to lactoylglutathione lyase
MLVFGAVSMGADDPSRAATFWCAAMGLEQRRADDDDHALALVTRDGRPLLMIRHRTETSTSSNAQPTRLELYARDEQDQTAEIERLVALGAQQIGTDHDGYDHRRSLLVDTEGNPFAVVSNVYAPDATQIGLAAT